MAAPDFIGIGAQRSGSTWMHRLLSRHPQIWMTPVKEIHYFDNTHWERYIRNWKKRWRSRAPISLWDIRYFIARYPGDGWYRSLFVDANRRGVTSGEITPAYAILDEAGFRRIHAINPDIKIVFVMRDPVERSWSDFVNHWQKQVNGNFTLSDALKFCRKPQSLGKSLYGRTIAMLERVFDRDRIFYGFTDDIKERPEWFAARLFAFLGVDETLAAQCLPDGPVGERGRRIPIPAEFARAISAETIDDLESVAARFGGHPQRWLERAQGRMAASLPPESGHATSTSGEGSP
jgi:hypothetical protein